MYEQLELKRIEMQKEIEVQNLKFKCLELAGHKSKDNPSQLEDAKKFAEFVFGK